MANDNQDKRVKVDLIWKGTIFLLSAVALLIINKSADAYIKRGEDIDAMQSNIVAISSTVNRIEDGVKSQEKINTIVIQNQTKLMTVLDRQDKLEARLDQIQFASK